MSLLPSARVELDEKLDDADRAETLSKIKAVKGVISSAFNQKANAVAITYTGGDVRKEVEKIPGVKAFKPWRGF
ncbi:MAG: hypothetical protein GC185_01010 [Alphaproteobacteria bacterium]|nr:hypothetical protein [Alphaproteobacteria bacterium]